MEMFILRAFIAGIGVATVAGVIGCFVVWRKMAYFGDSFAHSALLGIALGVSLELNPSIGIIVVCLFFTFFLLWLQQKKILATDTLLGILAHASLSFGLITISLLEKNVNLHAYLFGDILTVSWQEIYWIYFGGGTVLLSLAVNWSSLVLMTISEDLAVAENVNTFFVHLLFMSLITLIVALSIQIVGVLLITSLLIIPAAAARQLAKSPESMAFVAFFLGALSVVGGIIVSLYFNTPSGPSIVAVSAVIFFLLFLLNYVTRR